MMVLTDDEETKNEPLLLNFPKKNPLLFYLTLHHDHHRFTLPLTFSPILLLQTKARRLQRNGPAFNRARAAATAFLGVPGLSLFLGLEREKIIRVLREIFRRFFRRGSSVFS